VKLNQALCLVYGCPRPMKAKGLCDAHWRQNAQTGKLRPIAASHQQQVSAELAGIYVRISKARARELDAEAKRLGFPSRYRLAARILEDWQPPGAEKVGTGVPNHRKKAKASGR
jgi:hypothetical protein